MENEEEKTIVLVGTKESDFGETKGEFIYKVTKNKYPDELLLKALEISGGNITRAARAMGIERKTISNRIKSSPEFREKYIQLKEVKIDFAEDVLWGHIEEHNLLATMFYLKTIGKDRGYTTQTTIVGDKDKPVNINIRVGKENSDDEYS